MIGLLTGYLLGSFPTAYLLVRWRANLDVRVTGSGNMGARNAYDVTGSGFLAIVILVVDALKGISAVVLASLIPGSGFWTVCAAGVGAILGHNYPVWIGFRGGRGLATGAGCCAVIAWPLVLVWCVVWGVSYPIVRNLHIANVIALVITPVSAVLIPWQLIGGIYHGAGAMELTVLSALCSCCILLRHIGPVAALRNSKVQ